MAHSTVVVIFQDDITKEGKVEHISSDLKYIFWLKYMHTPTHICSKTLVK